MDGIQLALGFFIGFFMYRFVPEQKINQLIGFGFLIALAIFLDSLQFLFIASAIGFGSNHYIILGLTWLNDKIEALSNFTLFKSNNKGKKPKSVHYNHNGKTIDDYSDVTLHQPNKEYNE